LNLLIKNAQCAILVPPSIERTDLRVENGAIVERGENLRSTPGEDVLDLHGKVVMPGFVCAHTHLYSTLTRGMPPPKNPPKNFLEILQNIWWRLDRALDDESIYYSVLIGAIEAIRCGTTTLVDHHSSPRAIKGSLDIIKEALGKVGMRGVLCYEVTDRGGVKERDNGLDENERFLRANGKDAKFRGLVGAHASFTLSNDSMDLCGEMAAENKTGVHIHVAEDKCDAEDAMDKYKSAVIDRLSKHGILRKESILAHCIHVPPVDFQKLHTAKTWLVHNPRSNMNNHVGHAPIQNFGERAALGTDGFAADMIEEARMGFFKMKDSECEMQGSLPIDFLQGGHRLVSEIFGSEFGTLASGSVADLIVLDYDFPTPLSEENLAWHFLFGFRSSMVGSVMVAGKWIVKDRNVVGMDVPSEYRRAAKVTKMLWDRMGNL
jgi:putative selenium metabolism protein SsnA